MGGQGSCTASVFLCIFSNVSRADIGFVIERFSPREPSSSFVSRSSFTANRPSRNHSCTDHCVLLPFRPPLTYGKPSFFADVNFSAVHSSRANVYAAFPALPFRIMYTNEEVRRVSLRMSEPCQLFLSLLLPSPRRASDVICFFFRGAADSAMSRPIKLDGRPPAPLRWSVKSL